MSNTTRNTTRNRSLSILSESYSDDIENFDDIVDLFPSLKSLLTVSGVVLPKIFNINNLKEYIDYEIKLFNHPPKLKLTMNLSEKHIIDQKRGDLISREVELNTPEYFGDKSHSKAKIIKSDNNYILYLTVYLNKHTGIITESTKNTNSIDKSKKQYHKVIKKNGSNKLENSKILFNNGFILQTTNKYGILDDKGLVDDSEENLKYIETSVSKKLDSGEKVSWELNNNNLVLSIKITKDPKNITLDYLEKLDKKIFGFIPQLKSFENKKTLNESDSDDGTNELYDVVERMVDELEMFKKWAKENPNTGYKERAAVENYLKEIEFGIADIDEIISYYGEEND